MSYFTGRLIWVLGHRLVAITTANFGYMLSCEGKWARLPELSETWSRGWEEGLLGQRQRCGRQREGERAGTGPSVFVLRI